MFGKLLTLPIRLLNVPLKVVDRIVLDSDGPDEDVLSVPLDVVADTIEDAIDED
jgi:hypothetical protein